MTQLRADIDRIERLGDRALGFLRAYAALHGAKTGSRVYVGGDLRLDARGAVTIGDRVTFVGGIIPTELRCERGARLVVGDESILNYGVSLDARAEIRVGRRCRMGSMVRISDWDARNVAPVVIGDDVWIAYGAIVVPGVTIGSGSVVSAGSVVTADVPPGTLAMGNPARQMSLTLVAKGR